jgi:hypothetical protein
MNALFSAGCLSNLSPFSSSSLADESHGKALYQTSTATLTLLLNGDISAATTIHHHRFRGVIERGSTAMDTLYRTENRQAALSDSERAAARHHRRNIAEGRAAKTADSGGAQVSTPLLLTSITQSTDSDASDSCYLGCVR